MADKVIKRIAIFILAIVAMAGSGWGNPAWAAFITSGSSQWSNVTGGINYGAGNVGVGSTNPGFPLDINANNYDAQLRIRQTTGTGYAPASVLLSAGESDSRGQGLFHYNEVSDTSWFTGIPYSTQSNKWIVAYKSATSWDGTVAQLSNALFTIQNNGNVGIGTSTPQTRLHVIGVGSAAAGLKITDVSSTGIEIRSSANGAQYIDFAPNSTSDTGYGTPDSPGRIIYNNVANSLQLLSSGNGITINNIGNVGIGSTTPVAKLAVSGGTGNVIYAGGGQIAGLNSTPINSDHAVPLGYLQANYTPSGTASGGVGNGITGQTLRHNGTSWVANSTLFNNGTNIGIGTSTPTDKLVVVGNIDLPLYNAWRYIKNSAASGGLRLSTGNPSGTEVIGIELSSGGGYVKLNHNTTVTGNLYTTGNIGVGTTTPAQKLDVSGNIQHSGALLSSASGYTSTWMQFDGVINGNSLILGAGGLAVLGSGESAAVVKSSIGATQETLYLTSDNDIQFTTNLQNGWSSRVDAMSIINSGNVGIGSTTPVAKLAVSGGTGNVIYAGGGQIAGLNSTPINSDQAVPLGYLQANYTPSGTASGGVGNGITGQTLRHNGTSWVANSTLYNNGTNVGIGTSTPGAKLQVNGNAIFGTIAASTAVANPVNVSFGSTYGNSTPGSVNNLKWDLFTSSSTGSRYGIGMSSNLMEFQSGPNGGLGFFVNQGTEVVRITSTSNVGIGTTNPGYKLEVGGTGYFTQLTTNNGVPIRLMLAGEVSNNASEIRTGGGEFKVYSGRASNAHQSFNFSTGDNFTSGSSRMYIQGSTGNVGIGTTNPGAKFEVLYPSGAKFQVVDYAGFPKLVGNSDWIFLGGTQVAGSFIPDADLSRSFGTVGRRFSAFYSKNITDDGTNVGVGTTTPVAKLAVSGGTGNVIYAGGGQIAGLNSTPTNTDHAVPLGYLQSNYAPIGTGAGSAFVQGGNSFGAAASLGTNDNNLLNIETNNTVRMTVAAGGNVGIGTTAPNRLLHVSSVNSSFLNLQITQNNSTHAQNVDEYGIEFSTNDADWQAAKPVVHSSIGVIPVNNPYGNTYDMAFRTGYTASSVDYANVEALRIKYNGNVGIGTSNPLSALDVNTGSVTQRESVSTYHQLVTDVNGLNIINNAGSANVTRNIIFKSAVSGGSVSEKMRITGSGSIGIGETNPASELHVYNSASSATLRVNSQVNNIDGALLRLTEGEATTYGFLGGYIKYDGNANRLDIGVHDAANSSYANDIIAISFPRASGNVGIGSTTPITKLAVSGGTGNVIYAGGGQIAGLNSTPVNSDHAVPLGYLQANYVPIGAGSAFVQGGNSFGAAASLGTNDNNLLNIETNNTVRMTIAANGNVGIGTTAPAHKLTVMGSGYFLGDTSVPNAPVDLGFYLGKSLSDENRRMEVVSPAGGVSYIDFTQPSVDYKGRIAYYLSDNSFRFYTNSSEKLRLDTNGNVGVGTTNPAAKLDITSAAGWDGALINTSGVISTPGGDTTYGLRINHNRLGSDNGSVSYGAYINNTAASSGNNHSMYGVYGYVKTLMQYSGDQAVGLQGTVEHDYTSRSTVTGGSMIGVASRVSFVDDSGIFTMPTTYGFKSELAIPANKTITNNYGLFLGSKTGLGTVTNNWGVYQQDSAAKNYFASNVGIATTSPVAKLAVSGGTGNVIYAGGGQIAGLNSTPTNSDHAVPLGYLQANYVPIGAGSAFVQGGNSFGAAASLGTNDNNLLNIETNNTVRMTIAANGNVGVGTTNPGRKLDVESSGVIADFQSTSNSSYIDVIGTSNQLRLGTYAGVVGLSYGVGTTPHLVINSSGNVGIGTTNPSMKLESYGTYGLPATSGATQTYGSLRLSQNGGTAVMDMGLGGANAWIQSGISSDLSAHGVGLLLNPNGGNVGIGTTTPTQKLSVVGNVHISTGTFETGAGSYTFFNTIGGSWAPIKSMGINIGDWNSNSGYGDIAVGTYDFDVLRDDGSSMLKVSNSGNVGIGTTTPVAKLAVSGGTGNVIYAGGGQIAGLNSTPVNSDHAVSLGYLQDNYSPSSGSLWSGIQNGNIYNGTNGSGNVGVGLTNPSQKFEVRGVSTFSGASSHVAIGAYTDDLTGLYSTINSNNHGDFVFGSNLKILTNHTLTTTNNHASLTGGAIVIGGNGYSNGPNSINFFAQAPGTATAGTIISPSSAAMVIKGGGNVGIGTTNPGNYRLKVAGNMAVTGTFETQTGSDFAEEFRTDRELEAGTVVVMGDLGYKSVKLSDKKHDKTVIGIVSDNPSIIAGRVEIIAGEHKAIVAMAGVVTVKASDVNGKITRGDLLASSDIPGYAMKTNGLMPGTVIGKALESLTGHSGEIKVLVNLQ